MIVLLYFCCFVLKYQSVKQLLGAHVCHVDLYILLPTLVKIYLLTYYLLTKEIVLLKKTVIKKINNTAIINNNNKV